MNKKYITDSVYGAIKISNELILKLTSTKEFKRLGRIKHLGVSDFLYPSATHTRLAHSFGVYWLAKKAIDTLQPDISEVTWNAVMAAALLHDIGHGPLSHNFEMISKFHHEDLTVSIIENPNSEIYKVFNEVCPQARIETVQIIKSEHKLQWCNQLISSELDVDRIDYLMRDSQTTGTTYGNIDWKWLIRNMVITDEGRLAFKVKALPSIEQILIGRFHMNEAIYHNYKNEAYAQLMPFFFNRLRQLYKKNKLQANYFTLEPLLEDRKISVEEFHIMDDSSLLSAMHRAYQKEGDEILKKLATNYLDRIQPTLITNDVHEWSNKQDPALENVTWRKYKIKEGWNFYNIDSEDEVYIIDNDKQIKKASELSFIINKLGDQIQLHKVREIGVEIK